MWEVKEAEESPDFVRAATLDYVPTGCCKVAELSLRIFSVLVSWIREDSVGAITGAETLTIRLLKALTDVLIFGGHLNDFVRLGCGELHAGVVPLHRVTARDAVATRQCTAVEVVWPRDATTELTRAVSTYLLAEFSAGQAIVTTLELNHSHAVGLVRGRVAVWEVEEAEEGPDFIRAAVLDHISTGLNEVSKFLLCFFSVLAPEVREARVSTISRVEAVAVGLTKSCAGVLIFSEHWQLPGAPHS